MNSYQRGLVLDLLHDFAARSRAAQRVRRAFDVHLITVPNYHGLGRTYSRAFYIDARRPLIPIAWGWRARRDLERDTVTILPLWLALALDLWDGRWAVVRLAIRLGLWSLPEGEEYVTGRLTAPAWLRRAVWCFLNDRDEAPPACGWCLRLADDGEPRSWRWKCRSCIALERPRFSYGFDAGCPGADRTVRWSVDGPLPWADKPWPLEGL